GGIANRYTGGVNINYSSIVANGASQSGAPGFGGGGIFDERGRVTVSHSTIARNVTSDAQGGGGIRIINPGTTLAVMDSVISDNIGGGISATTQGTANISRSTISNNRDGGLIFKAAAMGSIADSTVNSNNADSGGGIYIES